MRILHIVLNPFTNDSRVLKSAQAARLIADEVTVFAMHEVGLSENESVNSINIRRFPISTRKWPRALFIQMIKYLELLVRMRSAGIKWRPDIIHAHDLNALPIGYLIAKYLGAKLIYDSHELWAGLRERNSLIRPVRVAADIVEMRLSRSCDEIITVSPGIAEILQRRFSRDMVHVVKNVPDRWVAPNPNLLRLRKECGVPSENIVMLYQGNMANDGRIECLIDALLKIKTENVVLVLIGDGQAVNTLKSKITQPIYRHRIFYHPAVSPYELPFYTYDADIGIVAIPDICLSNRLSLPNKLFEFIQAQLPVVVSDLPEMKNIIDEFAIGLTYSADDSLELAAKIDALLEDVNLVVKCHENLRKAADILNWENERKTLLQIYRALLNR